MGNVIIDHDYSLFAKSVNLCTIKSLYNYYDLLLVKKIVFLSADSEFNVPLSDLFITRELSYSSRGKRVLKEFESNKDYVFHSISYRLRRSWNRQDVRIRDCCKFKDFKDPIFQNVSRFN